MRVIAPEAVTDAMLVAASVAENDYPAWTAAATYGLGQRAIVAATHRIYESVTTGNTGNNPVTTSPGQWIDIGPTNRWAMFDEAMGTLTTATGSIAVGLAPPRSSTVSVLDTDAWAVRVRVLVAGAAVYDQTRLAEASGSGRKSVLFHDLPEVDGASIEVTAGAASTGESVSVGTLLIGRAYDLGQTETAPTLGINDYSKSTTDDFGNTDVVERAWAKRLSIRTQIDNGAVDATQRLMAELRARACLWIGEEGFDSLTIYGFYKDFSVEIGEAGPAGPDEGDGDSPTGKALCTLTLEGLTTAGTVATGGAGVAAIFRNAPTQPEAPARDQGTTPPGWTSSPTIMPAGYYRWQSQATFAAGQQIDAWSTPVKVAGVNWADVIDDNAAHAKPEDGADVTGDHTAADTAAVGGKPSSTLLAELAAVQSQADTIHSDLTDAVADIEATTDALQAQATAAAGAIEAQGGEIDSLQTQTTAQGAAIASNATAISNAKGDLATLTQQVKVGSPNLWKNGGLEAGLKGYIGAEWSLRNANGWGYYADATAIGTYSLDTDFIDVSAGTIYCWSADLHVAATVSLSGVYVDILWYDASGTLVLDGDNTPKAVGQTFGVERTYISEAAPAQAVKARGRVIVAGKTTLTGNVGTRRMKFERGSTPTAWTGETAVTTVTQALAQTDLQVASVQSDLATVNSAISSNQEAISGLESSVATVEQQVTAGSPNIWPNGSFEKGLEGYMSVNPYFQPSTANGWGSHVVAYLPDNLASYFVYLDSALIPVEPSATLTVSADVALWTYAGEDASVWFEVFEYAADGVSVTAHYAAGTRHYGQRNFGAGRIAATFSVGAGAAYVRIRPVAASDSGHLKIIGWRQGKLERGSVATAYNSDASVSMIAAAVTTVEGKQLAYLRNIAAAGATKALLELVADGTWSGINLLADGIFLSNDLTKAVLEIVGGQATFNGRLNALGGIVVSTDGRNTIDMNSGTTRYNDGNMDRVIIGNLDA